MASRTQTLQIGLTGSIGMGKSAISKQFISLGFPVFDADAAVHKLYAAGGAAVPFIRDAFPAAVIDGVVSRPELSKLVLDDSSALRTLEEIVHPLVRREREEFYVDKAAQGHFLVLYDIPLLFENPKAQSVDYTIVASAGSETQKQRVLDRPSMTAEKLKAILGKQMPDEEKRRRADFVILTDVWPDSYAPAKAQIARVLENLVEREPERWQAWTSRRLSYAQAQARAFSRGEIDDPPPPPPPPPALLSPISQSPSRSLRSVSSGARAIRESFDLVLLDLDDTLVPVMPPLVAAGQALSAHLQTHFPLVHSVLLAEGGTNISRALGVRMKRVTAHVPLLAHDLTEARRLALLDALRESKGIPPVLGAETHATSAAVGSPRTSRGGLNAKAKPDVVAGTGGKLSPDRLPDQSPFRQEGYINGANMMADGLGVKHTADLLRAAGYGAGAVQGPSGYWGLTEAEVAGVNEAMSVFLRARSRVVPHLYPDALSCLEYFRGLGLRLGVVTNGNADLSEFEGGDYFGDLLVTSCQAGALKPSVVPFIAAAQRADTAPSRVLFIGDAIDKDVAGANTCGMVSVWLNRETEKGVFCGADPGPGGHPDITVDSLDPDHLETKILQYLEQPVRK